MSSFAIFIIMYKVNESWESYFINILHKFFTIYPGTMWGGFDAPCSLFLLKYNIVLLIFAQIRIFHLRWVSLSPSTWFSWYTVVTLSSGYALLYSIYNKPSLYDSHLPYRSSASRSSELHYLNFNCFSFHRHFLPSMQLATHSSLPLQAVVAVAKECLPHVGSYAWLATGGRRLEAWGRQCRPHAAGQFHFPFSNFRFGSISEVLKAKFVRAIR